MKEIQAIIQPFMLSKVTNALKKIDCFPVMTVEKVQGFGRGKSQGPCHRVEEDLVDYVQKVKIEVTVNDAMVDEVIKVIMETAHTGNIGDGKIFVYDVERVYTVRTGERDENAL